MKEKMHEQYYVGVYQRYSPDKVYNAIRYYPGNTMSQRYVKTLEEAKKVLNNAYKIWNKEKIYDENGKRYEMQKCGCIGISIESTKETDHGLEIIKHVIKKRLVTDWEVIEEMEIE